MTNKHIVISPASYDHLDALAKNWRMDKKEFTEHIINYFRLTGDDPTATKRDNTVLALKKLQDTFVSFIRKHETDHLKKIVDDFEATRKGNLMLGASNVFAFWLVGVLSVGLARLARVPFLRAAWFVFAFWVIQESLLLFVAGALGQFGL